MSETTKQELLKGLNEDLAHEYAAVIMYRTYASMVQGPYRQELRAFFGAEVPDELLHAQLLADKIAVMGGTPTTRPSEVEQAGDARAMLENALAAEANAVERYVVRRRQAQDLGEHGLAVDLDTLIADETKHRDELELMLARWE